MQTRHPLLQAKRNQSFASTRPQFEDARADTMTQLRLQSLMASGARSAQFNNYVGAGVVQRIPIGPNNLETTNKNHRHAVLQYLKQCDPHAMQQILNGMLLEGSSANDEYIQICRYELSRHESLNAISDSIRFAGGGVWTQATVFYEKQKWFSTNPQNAGGDALDGYGVGVDGSREMANSVKDSEVATLVEINDGIGNFVPNPGMRLNILIVGNMGPCDGCKGRLQNFVNELSQRFPQVNIELEANYTTVPHQVNRQRHDTIYGGLDDRRSVSVGSKFYYYQHYAPNYQ